MRRILSEKGQARKRKRNQIILGVFLVFTMFFSVIGYAFQSIVTTPQDQENNQTNGVFYNGFEFLPQNGFWILNKEGINLIFSNNPNQVNRIKSNISSIENYNNKTLYVYSENVLAESEIRNNLFNFVEKIENVCLEGEECGQDLQVKTCENNFIVIRESENSSITQVDNCVFINGKSRNLIRVTDEFLFKVLGIR